MTVGELKKMIKDYKIPDDTKVRAMGIYDMNTHRVESVPAMVDYRKEDNELVFGQLDRL